MKKKAWFLMVSTKKHPIKAYNLDALNKAYEDEPIKAEKFDEQWGHSLNIIEACENGELEFVKL